MAAEGAGGGHTFDTEQNISSHEVNDEILILIKMTLCHIFTFYLKVNKIHFSTLQMNSLGPLWPVPQHIFIVFYEEAELLTCCLFYPLDEITSSTLVL